MEELKDGVGVHYPFSTYARFRNTLGGESQVALICSRSGTDPPGGSADGDGEPFAAVGKDVSLKSDLNRNLKLRIEWMIGSR